MPQKLARLYWLRLERIFRRLARSTGSSHQIAFGVAIGMFIGMTPTVSIQMIIAAFVATLVGANRIAAIVPVWITNPATIVPIYTFNYWIGLCLVGGPDMKTFRTQFDEVIIAATRGGFFERIGNALTKLAQLGWDIQPALWTGCCLVGIVLAVPSYVLSKRAVEAFRRRLHLRRAARHTRFLSLAEVEADAPAPAEQSAPTAPLSKASSKTTANTKSTDDPPPPPSAPPAETTENERHISGHSKPPPNRECCQTPG